MANFITLFSDINSKIEIVLTDPERNSLQESATKKEAEELIYKLMTKPVSKDNPEVRVFRRMGSFIKSKEEYIEFFDRLYKKYTEHLQNGGNDLFLICIIKEILRKKIEDYLNNQIDDEGTVKDIKNLIYRVAASDYISAQKVKNILPDLVTWKETELKAIINGIENNIKDVISEYCGNNEKLKNDIYLKIKKDNEDYPGKNMLWQIADAALMFPEGNRISNIAMFACFNIKPSDHVNNEKLISAINKSYWGFNCFAGFLRNIIKPQVPDSIFDKTIKVPDKTAGTKEPEAPDSEQGKKTKTTIKIISGDSPAPGMEDITIFDQVFGLMTDSDTTTEFEISSELQDLIIRVLDALYYTLDYYYKAYELKKEIAENKGTPLPLRRNHDIFFAANLVQGMKINQNISDHISKNDCEEGYMKVYDLSFVNYILQSKVNRVSESSRIPVKSQMLSKTKDNFLLLKTYADYLSIKKNAAIAENDVKGYMGTYHTLIRDNMGSYKDCVINSTIDYFPEFHPAEIGEGKYAISNIGNKGILYAVSDNDNGSLLYTCEKDKSVQNDFIIKSEGDLKYSIKICSSGEFVGSEFTGDNVSGAKVKGCPKAEDDTEKFYFHKEDNYYYIFSSADTEKALSAQVMKSGADAQVLCETALKNNGFQHWKLKRLDKSKK